MYQLSHFSKKLDLGMALFMGQPYLASYGNSQVTFRLRNRHLPSQNEKISKRNREQHLKPTHKSLVISNEVSGSALGFTAFILLLRMQFELQLKRRKKNSILAALYIEQENRSIVKYFSESDRL